MYTDVCYAYTVLYALYKKELIRARRFGTKELFPNSNDPIYVEILKHFLNKYEEDLDVFAREVTTEWHERLIKELKELIEIERFIVDVALLKPFEDFPQGAVTLNIALEAYLSLYDVDEHCITPDEFQDYLSAIWEWGMVWF